MRTPRNPFVSVVALAVFAGATLFATTTITVSSGDTLSEIAEANGVSVAELVAWNDLDDPDLIVDGQRLTLQAAVADADPATNRHVVTAGETLSIIAARYGATVAALVEVNEIADADLIRAGETLRISGPAPDRAASPTPAVATPGHHVVAPGETLFSIARLYEVGLDELVTANGLADPDRIRSGRTLVIPADGPVEPAPEPEPPTPEADGAEPEPETEVEPEPEAEVESPPEPEPEPEPEATPEPEPEPTLGGQGPLSSAFDQWSASYGVPRELVEAVAWHASGWQPTAVGDDGRLGIGQLTPEQLELIETRLLGIDLDPLDTSDGVRLMARYLRYLRDRTHDDREALQAYHQGLSSFLDDGPSGAAATFADAVLAIREQRR